MLSSFILSFLQILLKLLETDLTAYKMAYYTVVLSEHHPLRDNQLAQDTTFSKKKV